MSVSDHLASWASLLQSVRRQGGFISEALQLHSGPAGRGLHAVKPIQVEDVLITLPWTCAFTEASAVDSLRRADRQRCGLLPAGIDALLHALACSRHSAQAQESSRTASACHSAISACSLTGAVDGAGPTQPTGRMDVRDVSRLVTPATSWVLLLALGLLNELRQPRSTMMPYLRMLPTPAASRLRLICTEGPEDGNLLLFSSAKLDELHNPSLKAATQVEQQRLADLHDCLFGSDTTGSMEPAVSLSSFIWAHCLVRSRALDLLAAPPAVDPDLAVANPDLQPEARARVGAALHQLQGAAASQLGHTQTTSATHAAGPSRSSIMCDGDAQRQGVSARSTPAASAAAAAGISASTTTASHEAGMPPHTHPGTSGISGTQAGPLAASAFHAQCMLPVVDLLNHDSVRRPVHLKVVMRAGQAGQAAGVRCVQVVATCSYSPGEEVTLDYGARPMRDMLRSYGFVPEDAVRSCPMEVYEGMRDDASVHEQCLDSREAVAAAVQHANGSGIISDWDGLDAPAPCPDAMRHADSGSSNSRESPHSVVSCMARTLLSSSAATAVSSTEALVVLGSHCGRSFRLAEVRVHPGGDAQLIGGCARVVYIAQDDAWAGGRDFGAAPVRVVDAGVSGAPDVPSTLGPDEELQCLQAVIALCRQHLTAGGTDVEQDAALLGAACAHQLKTAIHYRMQRRQLLLRVVDDLEGWSWLLASTQT